MSYKTIAVHLEAGPRCATRVALAARLAIRHGSRLVGIAATGLPDVIVAMNSAVTEAIECIALSVADLRNHAEAAARDFDRECRRAGVASFQSEVVIDEAVDAVVRLGRCSDLIVVGQTDVAGPVLRPGDPGWREEIAGFNLAYTPTPAVVVGATSTADGGLTVNGTPRYRSAGSAMFLKIGAATVPP